MVIVDRKLHLVEIAKKKSDQVYLSTRVAKIKIFASFCVIILTRRVAALKMSAGHINTFSLQWPPV